MAKPTRSEMFCFWKNLLFPKCFRRSEKHFLRRWNHLSFRREEKSNGFWSFFEKNGIILSNSLEKMVIFVGSDHAAYHMKTFVVDFLKTSGFSVEDLGTHSEESVDYPHYGELVAKKTVQTPHAFGVVLCGTGIGISIAANKVPGARAALCTTSTHARLARQHNNANIVAIGARITGTEVVRDILQIFFETDFEGGRHEKRVAQFFDIERNESNSQ